MIIQHEFYIHSVPKRGHGVMLRYVSECSACGYKSDADGPIWQHKDGDMIEDKCSKCGHLDGRHRVIIENDLTLKVRLGKRYKRKMPPVSPFDDGTPP